MVLEDSIVVLDDILMVEVLDKVDLFFDIFEFVLADRYLLHSHKFAVAEIKGFIDLTIGTLADGFDDLIALDCTPHHCTLH